LDDVRPERAADKKRRDRPFYFKRHKAGALLLALFIVTLVGAFLLYPRRSAVHQPGTPFLNINTTGTVESLYTSLQSPAPGSRAADSFALSIDLEVSMPAKMVTPPRSTIDIPLPVYIKPDCGQALGVVACTFQPGTPTTFPRLTAQAIFGAAQQVNGRRVWPNDGIVIPFAGPWLPLEANGLDVEGQLPVVSIGPPSEPPGSNSQSSASSNLKVVIVDYVPDVTGYDWTGGPEPLPVPSGRNYPASVEWIEPLSALSAPVAVTGTNHSAAEWDSFRMFMVGILVGVAGGALVGAIQEFYSSQRQGRIGS
jgi:hypothetical protein